MAGLHRIDITTKIHITNPCLKADVFRYDGPLDEFIEQENFAGYKIQKENCAKIQATLEPFNLALDHIWVGIFTGRGSKHLHFVAKDPTNTIFWQKYEGNSTGSGQNWLYIHGQKIKMTNWLNCTQVQRHDFFEVAEEVKNRPIQFE